MLRLIYGPEYCLLYFGKCSLCSWKEHVFCWCWVEHSRIFYLFCNYPLVQVNKCSDISDFHWIFNLVLLNKRSLKNTTIILDLFILLVLSLFFMHFEILLLNTYIFKVSMSLWKADHFFMMWMFLLSLVLFLVLKSISSNILVTQVFFYLVVKYYIFHSFLLTYSCLHVYI